MKLIKKEIKPSNFVLFLLLIIVSLLLIREFVIYIITIFLVSIFVYFNYHIKLPFDISPVLVISLIISRNYGFVYSFVFIIVSGIIPMILAGGSFDHTTLFYVSLIFLINYISILVKVQFLLIAFSLILIHHLIALFVGFYFGISKQKEMINFVIKMIVDGLYLFIFQLF